jgi:nucleoside-diphosphate-sugar epimerase
MLELAGSSSELELAPRRPWDHSVLRLGSPDKAARELGFAAETSLEDGLRRTIDWTKQNLPFIERCIARHADRLSAPLAAANG